MCELFVLETGVDASRSALFLVCAALRRSRRLARGRSFSQQKNASRSLAPRSFGTIAKLAHFHSAGGVWLDTATCVHHLITKQKAHTDV